MDVTAVVSALRGRDAELAARWLGPRAEESTMARELLAGVITSLDEGEADALQGPATAVGVVWAQQGHSPSGLVEEIVRVRPVLWGALAALPAVAGDLGALLLLQEQISEAVDRTLRQATAAFVEESTRVLEHRATRDALTGLVNRAAFDEALSTAVKAGTRSEPPSLILFDLDGFKAVNDTLGHLQGDDVLVRIGDTIAETVRGGDVAGRLGGDEFAVVLAETALRDAERVASRIVRKVAKDRDLRRLTVPVGISAGVGRLPGGSPDDLIAATDAVLYRAKDAGGNCVKTTDER